MQPVTAINLNLLIFDILIFRTSLGQAIREHPQA
jgi:hypothetical protein